VDAGRAAAEAPDEVAPNKQPNEQPKHEELNPMPVTIRLSLKGRTNRPFFRLGVFDQRTRRDGPPVEYLGWYDPKMKENKENPGAQFKIADPERVKLWISRGAKVSDTVRSFLKRAGIEVPSRPTTRVRLAKDAARRERSAAKKAPAGKPAGKKP
jgi:small subunit ribosomal protein S16